MLANLVRQVGPEALELDEFRWYQVPIGKIESETGVNFTAAFKGLDVAPAGPQAAGGGVRLIETSGDFFA